MGMDVIMRGGLVQREETAMRAVVWWMKVHGSTTRLARYSQRRKERRDMERERERLRQAEGRDVACASCRGCVTYYLCSSAPPRHRRCWTRREQFGMVVSVIETRDEDRSKKIIQLDRRVFASSITFFLRARDTRNYKMCSMTYTFSNNLGQYRTKNHINSRLESEFE